ncbi:MAG: protein kinase, partial [Muribaculaceae bacterium]|nr:protein kinase [Muribaculaceae bacterium]
MIDSNETESGFLSDPQGEFEVQTGMNDVEILRVTKTNIIARGRRYGRLWLLKGLRQELRESTVYKRQLQKEFEIHSRLHNPAVVQAVGFEEVPELGNCIVEEWIEGRTLTELLREGKLTKNERRKLLREIIEAAGYLHSMGVVHRDLKPANIMVRNAGKGIVIIDFGLADTDDYVELKQAAGSPGFISPEQQKEKKTTISDDIYSIGAIMKELTPEYGAIAQRCTGELNKRPKDSEELIRWLNRRDRRPKVIWLSAIITVVFLIGLFVSLHIVALSKSANEAKRSITEARNAAGNAQKSANEAQQKVELLNETNRRQEHRVAELKDSLNDVTARMTQAQEELNRTAEYGRQKEEAYKEGCRKIEVLLAHYDKEVFSKLNYFSQAGSDALKALLSKGEDNAKNSCSPQRFPNLTDADREKIRNDIYVYYLNKFTIYQKEWMNQW